MFINVVKLIASPIALQQFEKLRAQNENFPAKMFHKDKYVASWELHVKTK